MENKRLKWVDSCRGMAILLVIIVHVGQLFPNSTINFISSFAKNGVQMFFIISGYTLFKSIENNKNKSFKPFIIKRFFRIAPMYYLSAIYYCVISTETINIKYLIINVLFLNQFYLPAFNYIPPGGWSIATEMTFYLFIPFLFKKINSLNNSLVYLAGSLTVSISLNMAIYYFMKLYLARTYYISDSLFINNIPTLFLGILLYYLVRENKITLKSIYSFLIAIVLFLYLISKPFSNNYNNIYKLPNNIINYTYSFSLVVFLLIIGIYKLNQNSKIMISLQKIGKISFSIYLVHFTIISLIRNHININYNSIGFTFILIFLIVTFVSYNLSKITYKIELLGQELGNKIISKFNF